MFICEACVAEGVRRLGSPHEGPAGSPGGELYRRSLLEGSPRLPVSEPSRGPECSFCGKRPDEVQGLVAGPEARICNECLALCEEILAEDGLS